MAAVKARLVSMLLCAISIIGVNMAPTLVPALKMPLATARSLAGNHRRVVFTQAG